MNVPSFPGGHSHLSYASHDGPKEYRVADMPSFSRLRRSAGGDRISTPGTYELLAALHQDLELEYRGVPEQDPRRLRAHAAVVVAFLKADPLVACREGVISAQPSTVSGTIVAVSDEEAAEAYLNSLNDLPRAEGLTFQPLTQATGESPSQAVWLGALHRHGADHVVVNPCGPCGAVAVDIPLIRDLAPLMPRIRAPHLDKRWLSLEYRREERARLAASIKQIAGIARSDRAGSYREVEEQGADLRAFNSPLVDDTLGYLKGLARLRAGQDLADGLHEAVSAAVSGAWHGFPEHCVDAILEIRPWLLAHPDPHARKNWYAEPLTTSKSGLEGLLRAGLDWRTPEVEEFIADAARLIAATAIVDE